jgi:hypothetical protein
MNVWLYHHSGLSVASSVVIPDWDPFRSQSYSLEPDIHFNVLPSCEQVPSKSCVLKDGKSIWIVVPAVAAFHIRDGRFIDVVGAPSTPTSHWLPFLLGTAWNALCLQRGLFLMHASVVLGPSGALAFCGESGSGKSSTAAALLSQGLSLVCDDLCRIDVCANPLVYPAAQRLRLWTDAAQQFGYDPESLKKVLDGRDKYFVTPQAMMTSACVPLRAIFVLEWGEPCLVRLAGLNGLSRFISAATFRSKLIEEMGLVSEHWKQSLDLMSNVPVFIWRRPKDLGCLSTSLALIDTAVNS